MLMILILLLGCQESPSEAPFNHNSNLRGTVDFEEGTPDTISAAVKVYYSSENLLISETQTTPTGDYQFQNLASGTYNLSFSAPNYEDYSIADIVLEANQDLVVDLVQLKLIKEIEIREIDVDGQIDEGWEPVYINEHASDWGPNNFDNLYLSRTADSLYIAVSGEFSNSDNTVGIYIDKDYGQNTGISDFSQIAGGDYGNNLRKQVTTVESFGADIAFTSGWALSSSVAVVSLENPQSVDQNILEATNFSLNTSVLEFSIAFSDLYADGNVPIGSKIALVGIIGGGGDQYYANDSIPQPEGDFTGHFSSVFSRQF